MDVPDTPETPETGGLTDEQIGMIATYELQRSVTDLDYDDQNHSLTIKGLAYIDGVKAETEDSVKHAVVVKNTDTGESFEIEAKSVLNEEISSTVYYGYKYINYEAAIDLNTLQPGNYELFIRVVNGDYDEMKDLRYELGTTSYAFTSDDNFTTRVSSFSLFRNRLVISKEVEGVNNVDCNRPSSKIPSLGTDNITIENGHMIVKDGFIFMKNADMSASVNPVMKLYFEDENGNVTEFDAVMKKSVLDYQAMLGYDNDLSYASYDMDIDLTDLAPGKYRIWVGINTDEYNDKFEFYSQNDVSISSEVEGKSFSLVSTNTRQRYELTVE